MTFDRVTAWTSCTHLPADTDPNCNNNCCCLSDCTSMYLAALDTDGYQAVIAWTPGTNSHSLSHFLKSNVLLLLTSPCGNRLSLLGCPRSSVGNIIAYSMPSKSAMLIHLQATFLRAVMSLHNKTAQTARK